MNKYTVTITLKNFAWEGTAVRLHYRHLSYEEADKLFLFLQSGLADKNAISMYLKAENRVMFTNYAIIRRDKLMKRR